MRLLGLIKEKGCKYVLRSIYLESRKRLFVYWVKLTYKNGDNTTYSQYAEDLFIDKMLGYKKTGSYIDVGANHPDTLNNTKKFYERGWRGINIEPNCINYKLFLEKRSGDMNLNIGVGNSKVPLIFYSFQPDTLSTFLKDVAEKLVREGFVLIEKKEVDILSLSDIFVKMNNNRVDFITIDTEGYDEEVLRSNDWENNRARVVCIEDESGHEHDAFFSKIDYRKVSNNGLNTFFVDKRNFGY
jgi:FkbM family methyltransferase